MLCTFSKTAIGSGFRSRGVALLTFLAAARITTLLGKSECHYGECLTIATWEAGLKCLCRSAVRRFFDSATPIKLGGVVAISLWDYSSGQFLPNAEMHQKDLVTPEGYFWQGSVLVAVHNLLNLPELLSSYFDPGKGGQAI